MRTLARSLLLGALAVLPATALAGDNDVWYADFDEAVKAAREQKKDLFVDFTGSDWCGWCIRLHKEVFDHEEFLAHARENFVLVALDFPRDQEVKDRVPNPKRNDELKDKYRIQGFPTILLMTPDGDAYARTGYLKGGPEPYVKHLDELLTTARKSFFESLEIVKEYEKAEGARRGELMMQALEKLESLSAQDAAVPKLAVPVKAFFETDATNAEGLKMRATRALMEAGQFDDDVRTAAKQLDPKNKEGLLEQVVAHQVGSVASIDDVKAAVQAVEDLDLLGIQDKELALRLYLSVVDWSSRFLEDPAKASAFAKKAKPLAEGKQKMLDFLERFLTD